MNASPALRMFGLAAVIALAVACAAAATYKSAGEGASDGASLTPSDPASADPPR